MLRWQQSRSSAAPPATSEARSGRKNAGVARRAPAGMGRALGSRHMNRTKAQLFKLFATLFLVTTGLAGCTDSETTTDASAIADGAGDRGRTDDAAADAAPVDAPADASIPRDSASGADTSSAGDTAVAAARPNILLLVADDLGYSDIGAFGG